MIIVVKDVILQDVLVVYGTDAWQQLVYVGADVAGGTDVAGRVNVAVHLATNNYVYFSTIFVLSNI